MANDFVKIVVILVIIFLLYFLFKPKKRSRSFDSVKPKIHHAKGVGRNSYLIEFRFLHNPTKIKIKKMIWHIHAKFNLNRPRRPVPHITLAGPLTTNDENRLVKTFHAICSKHSIMEFKVKNFNTFEASKVVYLDIIPSKKLEDFRWHLSRDIQSFCNLRSWDYEKNIHLHSTLAMRIPSGKYKQVRDYVEKMKPLNINHILARATLMKRGRILVEYDFLQKKLLTRRQALNRKVLSITFNKLRQHIGNQK